jgi:hypothetical protein
VLSDPGDVPEKLPHDPIIPPGDLQFDHDIVVVGVKSQNVDSPVAYRELDAGDAFLLVQRQARLYQRQVPGEEVLEVPLIGELGSALRFVRLLPFLVDGRRILCRLVEPKALTVDLVEQVILRARV